MKLLSHFLAPLTILPFLSAHAIAQSEGTPHLIKEFFPLQKTVNQFVQDKYDKNQISVVFQARDAWARNIDDLTQNEISIKENGQNISKFSFTPSTVQVPRNLDVVFAIDTTASMKDVINTLKMKVTQFVADLKKQNVTANLCLVTFDDQVQKTCRGFVPNIKKTIRNENLDSFIDELTKLNPAGGRNPTENILAALKSTAETTPWHKDAQRMVILLSDSDGFWYAPNHTGEGGTNTPSYTDAAASLLNNQVAVFAATLKMDGFAAPFDGNFEIPKVTGGAWFDIDQIVLNNADLNDIFQYIRKEYLTSYTLTYIVEDNQLDPKLPLASRNIVLQTSRQGATLNTQSTNSNLPNGRPDYKTHWPLTAADALQSSAIVTINGVTQNTGWSFSNGEIIFASAPIAGAVIQVAYERLHLIDNVLQKALSMGSARPFNIRIRLNNLQGNQDNYIISTTTTGEYIFEITPLTFDDSDPFDVRLNNGLNIELSFKTYP